MAEPSTTDAAIRTPRAHYPVVVLGGGINGIGTFRELAVQGVSCLLVEKTDFCSGTSAAPSRLIHGGIKYLETGELRLVRQSTLERNRLLICAPHCVKPIETVVPARSWLGGIVPSIVRALGGKAKLADRGLLILACGVKLFDWFGRHHRTMPTASFDWGGSFRSRFPDLDPGIVGAASYWDAKIASPERLGLELVQDAVATGPDCLALNYASVVAVDGASLHLLDHANGTSHVVTADLVVNAAGAWIDRTNHTLGIETAYIGGQKGSHLIVRNDRLKQAIGEKMVYFGSADGRISLLYVYLGNVLIGSTDLPVEDPDGAVCDDAEIAYMIAAIAEVFPDIPVTRDQIRYRYAGVRPLPRSDPGDPGAVSRDHSIREDRLPGTTVPVLSLIGGKWTTFRGFAEEAADRILSRLGRTRIAETGLRPIGGGRNYPADAAARASFVARLASMVGEDRASVLFERYGTDAVRFAEWSDGQAARPLQHCPEYDEGEIECIVATELVCHLTDVLHRRTDIALSGGLTDAVVREVARLMALRLGWDDARLDEEIAGAIHHGGSRHGVGFSARPVPARAERSDFAIAAANA